MMIETKELKIELETISPFRIGGKKDPFSASDQPIARIGDKFAVQGTSLKGALRHEIEKYLIDKYSSMNSMKPCIPSSERSLSTDERELITSGKYKGVSCGYPKNGDCICPACYLLGAQGLIGFVITPFLNGEVTPSDLYGVRIDRSKNVVAKGTNREYQIVPEGLKFTGVMTVLLKDDIRNWELGKPRSLKEPTFGDKWLESSGWNQEKIIKELIKERLENIKVLGGLKSSGAGKVKITVTQV